jgi:hypothetical protein
MKRTRIVLGLLALGLLPAARAGAASDWVPGSSCKLSFRSTGSANYFDGELFNEGSNTVFVDCTPTILPTSFNYKVWYVDNRTAGNLRCYSYQNPNGSFSVSQSRFSCAASSGCPTNSDPGFASNSLRFLSIPGGMGITCEVPAGINIKRLELAY